MAKEIMDIESFDEALSDCLKNETGYYFEGTCKLAEVTTVLSKYGWKPASMQGNAKSRIKRTIKAIQGRGFRCYTYYNSKSNRQVAFVGVPEGYQSHEDSCKMIIIVLSRKNNA